MNHLIRRAAFGVVFAVLLSGSSASAQDAAIIKELSRLEDVWAASIAKKDGAAIGKMLAPNFLSMDSSVGQVVDKSTIIKNASSSTDTFVSVKAGDYKGQVFGNTAVIVGISTLVTKTATGASTLRVAWTDTWMKQADGQWLCIASQSARLAK